MARRAPAAPRRRGAAHSLDELYDPGRERRAEQRARELLRSCVNEEEWGMYRDLGFIRVAGRHARREIDRGARAAYAYLVYPHKPIVAYVPGERAAADPSTASSFPTSPAAAAATACPPPTTCSPSGWRSPPTRTA